MKTVRKQMKKTRLSAGKWSDQAWLRWRSLSESSDYHSALSGEGRAMRKLMRKMDPS